MIDKEQTFVVEALKRAKNDTNTRGVHLLISNLANRLSYQKSRNLFEVNQSKAKWILDEIEFYEYAINQLMVLLNGYHVCKDEIEKKERCISQQQNKINYLEIDLHLQRNDTIQAVDGYLMLAKKLYPDCMEHTLLDSPKSDNG